MATRWERPQPFEELDHTADAGVIARGASADEALARLVLAFSELVTGGAPVRREAELVVRVEASDRAAMAVDVLRELLYRFDSELVIPVSCEVRRFDPSSGAEVLVEIGPYDPEAHAEGLSLKAVTLHDARFDRDGEGWIAQVVFDV